MNTDAYQIKKLEAAKTCDHHYRNLGKNSIAHCTKCGIFEDGTVDGASWKDYRDGTKQSIGRTDGKNN